MPSQTGKTTIRAREAKMSSGMSGVEQSIPEEFTQRKRPEQGQFRLQVDRQTKASYATFEAAETAGLAVKKGFPKLQVAVYDSKESVNTIIELPDA